MLEKEFSIQKEKVSSSSAFPQNYNKDNKNSIVNISETPTFKGFAFNKIKTKDYSPIFGGNIKY